MGAYGIIEGTGREVTEFAHQHRQERCRLLPLEPDAQTWAEVMQFIHSYKGKLPVLHPDATSTDELYDSVPNRYGNGLRNLDTRLSTFGTEGKALLP